MEEAINCASEDTPEPKILSPGEVIVKLQAAALNHIDVWTRLEVTGCHFNATILEPTGSVS
jgi:NADPH:quinone reductase-like Zn-dependent oxidoreductase